MMVSPEIIGARRRSLPAPPRNFETVTDIGSREASTCLMGGSARMAFAGAGTSTPNVKICWTLSFSSSEKTKPTMASSTAMARCMSSSISSPSGRSVFRARPTS